jgi:hypothetical protein
MIAELDAPVTQVRAVAIAGKRDCMYLVARSTQRRQHAALDPRATPGAVHQHDRSSTHSPLCFSGLICCDYPVAQTRFEQQHSLIDRVGLQFGRSQAIGDPLQARCFRDTRYLALIKHGS